MYILFNHYTGRYSKSTTLPEDLSNFDVIDIENNKVISSPPGEYALEEHVEEVEEEEEEDDTAAEGGPAPASE